MNKKNDLIFTYIPPYSPERIQRLFFLADEMEAQWERGGQSLSKLNILHCAICATSNLPLANFQNSQGSGWFCARRSVQAEAMRQVE